MSGHSILLMFLASLGLPEMAAPPALGGCCLAASAGRAVPAVAVLS